MANEAAIEELKGHAARETGDHGADVGHRGVDLAHIGAREAMRETGELREGDRVVVGALEAVVVAPRELTVEEELGGFFHVADKGLARDRAQGFAGLGELLEVATDESGISDADFERLAGDVELDFVEAPVGLAEAEDGNVDGRSHGSVSRFAW